MDADLVWFDLGDDYGVLEVDERLTPPGLALELHGNARVVALRSPRDGLAGARSTSVNL